MELCPTSRLTLVLLLLRGQADVAVTTAAAINMTEPCMTGIGSDCFCLLFDAETGRVKGLNGSGPCAKALTLDAVAETIGPPLLRNSAATATGAVKRP